MLLAFLDDRADTGRSEDSAEPEASGANSLDQRALRNELDLQFAGHHLSLCLGVEADVADDRFADQPRRNELADPPPGDRGVVGDHRQVAFSLAHDLVDDRAPACPPP